MEFDRYYEPFLGSAALFFLLQPTRGVLNDRCADLIATYKAVRDYPQKLVKILSPLKPDKDLYYLIRGAPSQGVQAAADFIYLNRTCWNGLYRVNGMGKFNVPYGAPKTDFIMDPKNLRACSAALSPPKIKLISADYEDAVAGCGKGDFVYFDPPYVTGHNNNGFRDWNEDLFSWADQKRLAKLARSLTQKGAHVVVSNANHSEIKELYRGFTIIPIERSSTLASDPSKRRMVSEVLIMGQRRRSKPVIRGRGNGGTGPVARS